MNDSTLVKDAGTLVVPKVLVEKAKIDYADPLDVLGGSTRLGASNDLIVLHLKDGASKTIADDLLDDVELPTVTSGSLNITSNVGAFIVNDVYAVTADGTYTKYILITIGIDDTSGDLEIIEFEKTTGEYDSAPAGKTVLMNLKEYQVVASGSSLTENANYIR